MQQSSNFSLQGAVDLGARQAAAKRRQQAAQATAAGGGSEFVFDVTEATFNADVVTRSQSVPVVVDLWAEWCGPCKQLSPVLERLAAQAGGAWVLAKIDVDANPQISAAFQVQSIPMVMAVIGGQLVPGFLGVQPEAQIREWLSQLLQVAGELGLPGGAGGAAEGAEAGGGAEAAGAGAAGAGAAGAGPAGGGAPGQAAGARAANGRGPAGRRPEDAFGDPRLTAAQQAMEVGDLNGAANALEQVLADSPGDPVAKAWLAQVELFRRVSSYDAEAVRLAAERNPGDPQAQAEAADVELATGQVQASFDRMLGVVQRTAGPERDKARQHLLGLFDVVSPPNSPQDPLVTKARARLSSLLF